MIKQLLLTNIKPIFALYILARCSLAPDMIDLCFFFNIYKLLDVKIVCRFINLWVYSRAWCNEKNYFRQSLLHLKKEEN